MMSPHVTVIAGEPQRADMAVMSAGELAREGAAGVIAGEVTTYGLPWAPVPLADRDLGLVGPARTVPGANERGQQASDGEPAEPARKAVTVTRDSSHSIGPHTMEADRPRFSCY